MRVQYVSVPAVSNLSSVSSVSTDTGTSATSEDTATSDAGLSDSEVSTLRAENLVRRSRGRTGTVKTGFGGLLSTNKITPNRKSLLGE
jgi:hypothetical protein